MDNVSYEESSALPSRRDQFPVYYNTELEKQVVATLRAKLEQFETVYGAVPTQVDAAEFCRLLRTEIDRLLPDAARASGYSSDHLRRLIRMGHIRTLRTGRRHKVLLSEVPRRHRGARSLTATEVEVPAPCEGADTASADRTILPSSPDSAPVALATSRPSRYDPTADARMAAARVRGERI